MNKKNLFLAIIILLLGIIIGMVLNNITITGDAKAVLNKQNDPNINTLNIQQREEIADVFSEIANCIANPEVNTDDELFSCIEKNTVIDTRMVSGCKLWLLCAYWDVRKFLRI